MTDTMRFKSPEEVREYLRSELSRTDSSVIERMHNVHEVLHSLQSSSEIDVEEIMVPFIKQWRRDNPESAQELDRMSAQVLNMIREAALRLQFVFSQVSVELSQWMRNNPEALRRLVVILQILASDGIAAGWRKRYEEEGDAIPFDDSVRLSIGLMAFRIPYRGTRRSNEGNLTTIYDYEMRAIGALRDDCLRDLIEGARSSPVDFRALQAGLSHLLETQEPVPSELIEWGLSVAAGNVTLPKVGSGRSPYTNQVRDALIVQTVRSLVGCGLNATRNEASAPESACDAVSEALKIHGVELSYAGVAKIWQSSKHQDRAL